jgi:transcriptional regulator with XRE-family HTH domain
MFNIVNSDLVALPLLAKRGLFRYDSAMTSDGLFIRAWRVSSRQSIEDLAEKAGIPGSTLEALETDARDIRLGTIEAVARGLGIPPAWLHTDPAEFDVLFSDDEEEDPADGPRPWRADPLFARIRESSRGNRALYALVTALLDSGDPKLIRAAEVSLRSLLKQARKAGLPWESRPSGHFEPPSD